MNERVNPSLLATSTKDESKDYVLSILRVVSARLKLIDSEVQSIGVALSRGLITPGHALLRIEQVAPGCYDTVVLSVFDGEAPNE
jgi:hypothetical protein